MSSVKDVDQQLFVVGFADFLKKSGKMQVPEWADLIKLSRFNEQGPHNPDWFFVRAASVARHLYIRAPAGVGAFTKIYGARKRNGSAPSHFMRSSQSVSRRVLQVRDDLKSEEGLDREDSRINVRESVILVLSKSNPGGSFMKIVFEILPSPPPPPFPLFLSHWKRWRWWRRMPTAVAS